MRHAFRPGPRFQRRPYLLGAREGAADIAIFRQGIKRNQPIAVLAVGLESVADPLRPFPEYLRALRAFDFHFFVDHECSLTERQDSAVLRFKVLFRRSLKSE